MQNMNAEQGTWSLPVSISSSESSGSFGGMLFVCVVDDVICWMDRLE